MTAILNHTTTVTDCDWLKGGRADVISASFCQFYASGVQVCKLSAINALQRSNNGYLSLFMGSQEGKYSGTIFSLTH